MQQHYARKCNQIKLNESYIIYLIQPSIFLKVT